MYVYSTYRTGNFSSFEAMLNYNKKRNFEFLVPCTKQTYI
jgi:hypothetical protein